MYCQIRPANVNPSGLSRPSRCVEPSSWDGNGARITSAAVCVTFRSGWWRPYRRASLPPLSDKMRKSNVRLGRVAALPATTPATASPPPPSARSAAPPQPRRRHRLRRRHSPPRRLRPPPRLALPLQRGVEGGRLRRSLHQRLHNGRRATTAALSRFQNRHFRKTKQRSPAARPILWRRGFGRAVLSEASPVTVDGFLPPTHDFVVRFLAIRL